MHPFIHLWFLNIKTFGLMIWLAGAVAAWIMDRNFRRAGVKADALSMVAIAVVAGLVGARLWHVLDTPMEFREMGWSVLWDAAGFAWFGGLVFGISALLFQGWWAKIGALRTLDLAAPAAAVGYGIGRVGCFLSGDGCYGIPTKLPWGMSFPNGIEPTFERVHPTPLYELGAGLLIGAWLWWRGGKKRGSVGFVECATGQSGLGRGGHGADCRGRPAAGCDRGCRETGRLIRHKPSVPHPCAFFWRKGGRARSSTVRYGRERFVLSHPFRKKRGKDGARSRIAFAWNWPEAPTLRGAQSTS
jgi:phosphatidylglycerol:prolipoprotein diacylglycerol transferase